MLMVMMAMAMAVIVTVSHTVPNKRVNKDFTESVTNDPNSTISGRQSFDHCLCPTVVRYLERSPP